MYITGGTYSEYVYYWTAAARGYYPNTDQPWIPSNTQTGQFDFTIIPGLGNHPNDYYPDIDQDGYTQMDEAFNYANDQDTWSDDNYYYNPYITGKEEVPSESDLIPFTERLYTLVGLAGDVENTQTIENRNYLIGGSLIIGNNATLSIEEGADIYLLNEQALLRIDNGSQLNIGNQMYFVGTGENNTITVNGNLQVGSYATFEQIGEILLNNTNLQTSFISTTFIDNTSFKNYGQSLTINNSTFDNCFSAYSFISDVNISNTDFINTSFTVSNSGEQTTHTVNIDNNDFFNAEINTMAAIKLMCVDEFFIENNNISGYDKGIEIWYSGEGASGNQNILENDISSNDNGILLYNTIASVAENIIYENEYGVKFLSRSNVAFKGDPVSGIQNIYDNDSFEVYCSEESFPWYFRYNNIVDEDNAGNPTDPLVYHNNEDDYMRDVRYNCWGTNFSASEDLYPVNVYNYLPIYCISKKSTNYPTPDEELYNQALDEFEAGNYDSAQIIYKKLVDTYNSSPYSTAALKDLFALEQFAGNLYDSLKIYYQTNDSILADSSLQRLADYMANKCDIKLENWQIAIDWFEDIILNPESFEDSVFAVIDLGYLYLMMDTTMKSISGNLHDYRPGSLEEFYKNSYYLISLLPGDRINGEEKQIEDYLKPGELVKNVPNPFSHTTMIQYLIHKPGDVNIKIFKNNGQELKEVEIKNVNEGTHNVEVNMSGFAPGIYFYSLYIDNICVDTKKLVLVK